MNGCKRQKLCIYFEQNSVFAFNRECFLWKRNKQKEQKDKLVGNSKMKCFSMSCEKRWLFILATFVRNQHINFLKCWCLGKKKKEKKKFSCIGNNCPSLFLPMVRLPDQLSLQTRERYCYHRISLNPIAQLSSQSHKHGKKGFSCSFCLINIRVLNEGHLLSRKLSQSLSLLLKLFHFL